MSREHKALERLEHKNVKHGRGQENKNLQQGREVRQGKSGRKGEICLTKGEDDRKNSKETMRGQYYCRQEGRC